MAKKLKITWVGWLNILVLQWLFMRLARCYNKDHVFVQYKILWGIVPLTGWWSRYIQIHF